MKAPRQNYRLLSSRQFRAVYEKGQRLNTPFFSAFILRTDTEQQRLGLTTTRKIGKAVLRNRCRRRLREIFRLRDQTALSGLGFDVVLNVRSNVATAEYQEIASAFAQMLQRFRQSAVKAKNGKEAK